MTVDEYQIVIDELQVVLNDTRATMERFEASGMNEKMSDDYAKLEAIVTQAVKELRHYVLQMLGTSGSPTSCRLNHADSFTEAISESSLCAPIGMGRGLA